MTRKFSTEFVCRVCGKKKSRSEFPNRQWRCKECRDAAVKEWAKNAARSGGHGKRPVQYGRLEPGYVSLLASVIEQARADVDDDVNAQAFVGMIEAVGFEWKGN